MKKLAIALVLVGVISFTVVPSASAHERQLFHIGDKDYIWVVGSLNEPTFVDDKSGVDLRIKLADPKDPTNSNAVGAKPVEGLNQTLKVEVSAGDKKKVMDLEPVFGTPGSYAAAFYPTVATTFSYRFFGTIDGSAVDVTFSCNPAGHPATPEDKNAVKLSDSVTRNFKAGAFGCPRAKADAGFPEVSSSINDLTNLHSQTMAESSKKNSATPLVLSIVALVIALGALSKTRKG